MDNLEAFYIPKTLDEPERILFFTVQEFGIFMIPFFIGILLGSNIKGILASFILIFLYKKVNKNSQNLSHLIYWFLPNWCTGLKDFPPSYYRIFI